MRAIQVYNKSLLGWPEGGEDSVDILGVIVTDLALILQVYNVVNLDN